jgi:hypothetical protein
LTRIVEAKDCGLADDDITGIDYLFNRGNERLDKRLDRRHGKLLFLVIT